MILALVVLVLMLLLVMVVASRVVFLMSMIMTPVRLQTNEMVHLRLW